MQMHNENEVLQRYGENPENFISLQSKNSEILLNEEKKIIQKCGKNSDDVKSLDADFSHDFKIPGTDPADWNISEFTIDYVCKNGYSQNLDSNFSRSKRLYRSDCRGSFRNVYRYLNKSYFETTLINEFSRNGFSDWKIPNSINKHENSLSHKTCVIKMKNRSSELNRVDKTLQYQVETEKEYWKNVLIRVCAVVKSLSSRSLPFRDDNEQFGSLHNCNFMMCLELIAEFDPFLAKHILNHGNHGKGHTNYLSHFTHEQFIKLMAVKVQNKVVEEIIRARYFSISIGSTPDIGDIHQLSFIFRYVNSDGLPVERFLCFLENVEHKSQNMADAVFSMLKSRQVDTALLYIRGGVNLGL
ncbi:zinc finger MYM-type protein 1-like, partial [Aphis craccivora]